MHVTFCAERGRGKAPPVRETVRRPPGIMPDLRRSFAPFCARRAARLLHACHPRPANGYNIISGVVLSPEDRPVTSRPALGGLGRVRTQEKAMAPQCSDAGVPSPEPQLAPNAATRWSRRRIGL